MQLFVKILGGALTGFGLLIGGGTVVAATHDTGAMGMPVQGMSIEQTIGTVYLAEADSGTRIEKEPLPGSLVLPASEEDPKKEKKCMTVCARWGEECMLINRGSGGTSRKCRRTCKQFAEECF